LTIRLGEENEFCNRIMRSFLFSIGLILLIAINQSNCWTESDGDVLNVFVGKVKNQKFQDAIFCFRKKKKNDNKFI